MGGVAGQEHRLDDEQIETYVALMEVAGQLRFRLERHLRAESQLTYVQFEILGRLMRSPDQQLRMTDLADGIVFSRSGLTYQVTVLADAGLVERSTSSEDERSILVQLTGVGRDLFLRLLPGHVEIVRSLLFDAMPERDVRSLGAALSRIRAHIRALPPRSAHGRRSRPTSQG